MAQTYAEMWNLDFKPNMKIWDSIEKLEEEKRNMEDEKTGKFRCGSICYPGMLKYQLRCLVSNSNNAMERRQLRKDVRNLIDYMIKREQDFRF